MLSRQAAKLAKKEPCHFDQREKSFLDPSHSLGMTGLSPSPWRLCVFARDTVFSDLLFIPKFQISLARFWILRVSSPRQARGLSLSKAVQVLDPSTSLRTGFRLSERKPKSGLQKLLSICFSPN